MVRRSVSAHRRRAMSRRYEPPSADVIAIQNSALASLPIVEIHKECVISAYVYTARVDAVVRYMDRRSCPVWHPAMIRYFARLVPN